LKNKVYWYSLKAPKPGAALSKDLKTTVAVIGGGVAGLSCAQKLHAAGVPVVLIEKKFCGAGASGKTSGFITPDSEIELSSLLESYGPEKAKHIWEFVLSGVALIQKNIRDYKIDCDHQVQDSLLIANNASGFEAIKKEDEARKSLGYSSTLYDSTTIKNAIHSEHTVGAVRYPKTFGINSYLYCLALRDELRKSGVPIFEQTKAERIEDHTIFTPGGQITADKIILCTDRFIPELDIAKKEIYHVQTFLGVTKPLSDQALKSIFPSDPMMVWDSDLVYNYFRVTGDQRLLIGGGDLFYTYARELSRNTARFSRRLTNYIHKKFPTLDFQLEYLWPGMLGVSKDLLPIMGPDKNNSALWMVGAATGLPWAAALGVYAAEKILTNRNDFDADFSPERHFTIGPRLQSLLTTPLTYALSHGLAKR